MDHLPVSLELERSPQLRGRPVVITQAARVLDASPRAAGVRAGMPPAEARARCPDAVLVEADPAACRRVWDDVLEAMEDLALDVEDAGLGLAYVRLDNAARLFGGLEQVPQAVLRAVPSWLHPRLGVAPAKFPAYAAAGRAGYGRIRWVEGDTAAFLAPLPVEVLPVDFPTLSRLRSFGLGTLGQVAALAAGALQAQFGPTGRVLWELARGVDRRRLEPRQHEETVEEWLTFPSPQGSLAAILTATEVLLGRAFSRAVLRGRTARVCTLEGEVFRAPGWKRRLVFREPLADRAKAVALVRPALEGHPPPGALEDLRLTLSGLAGEAGRQESLFADARRRENLGEVLRQLRARLGKEPPVYQVREVEPWSRIPERRRALAPFVP